MTAFAPKYRQRKERIGMLRQRAAFYTPTISYTATGGEKRTWVLWTTVWCHVENIRASEKYEADRRTAFNTKRFTCRAQSLDGVNEKMVLQHDGEQYDIFAINPVQDLPVGSFYEITAERRDETITPVSIIGFVMAYAQKNASFTGTDWTITAGTLPDPATVSEDEIHERVMLYRSGLRMVYSTDFSIQPGNVIRFTSKVRAEILLVHQYNAVT